MPPSLRHSVDSGRLRSIDFCHRLSGYRRAFTIPGADVPLRPESTFHFPESVFDVPLPPKSMFHFVRNRRSTSSGIRTDGMTARYLLSHGHPDPVYRCQPPGDSTGAALVQGPPAAAMDRAVSELLLQTVTPRVDPPRCRPHRPHRRESAHRVADPPGRAPAAERPARRRLPFAIRKSPPRHIAGHVPTDPPPAPGKGFLHSPLPASSRSPPPCSLHKTLQLGPSVDRGDFPPVARRSPPLPPR